MKKTAIGIGVLVLMALAAPLFAQGPFADVPTDHWAYQAVNELQQAGIIIGYPDQTFGGKRAMTRYEFAVAIARAIPILQERILAAIPPTTGGQPNLSGLATKEELNALNNRVTALENKPSGGGGVDTSKFVTMDQFNKLQSLVNEFRDEIASLGVDVDALKRDVAALAAQVTAIQRQLDRMPKISGVANLWATATNFDQGTPFDLDNRPIQPRTGPGTGRLINTPVVLRDVDLMITGRPSRSLTAVADINFGNYLPAYLGGVVTDYVREERTTAVQTPGLGFSNPDSFFPYYMYAEAGLGIGSLTVGRMPVQFTPYTLKLIDVDSYSVNDKTDSGNYPLDGGKLTLRFGGKIGLTAFAAKTDENSVLGNGLISQPTIGLYNNVGPTVFGAPFNDAGGHAFGGLPFTTQVAGARLNIGTPLKGNLGATYIQAAGPVAGFDTTDVFGGDLRFMVSRFPIGFEYAQTRTKDHSGDIGGAEINDNNKAWDGKIGLSAGKLGIDLGYRRVENNFTAPGYWDKIGMWTNPSNIRGPYANLTFGLAPSLSLIANGEFYKGAKDVAGLPGVINDKGDKLWKAEGGLKWGLTTTNSVNLGIEYVRWEPVGSPTTKEQYINIGFAHQLSPNAGLSIGYQIIDYKPGVGEGAIQPYGATRSKGGVAVAQLKANF